MTKEYTAYLSLGSNLGDREKYISDAINGIIEKLDVIDYEVSPFYETEPWGNTNQPRFINAAMMIRTSVEPSRMLDITQEIERELFRVRHEHWGARTIDIDILCVEGVTMNTPRLTLPHPYMTQRDFVLTPMADIAPGLRVNGKTISEWRKDLRDFGSVPL